MQLAANGDTWRATDAVSLGRVAVSDGFAATRLASLSLPQLTGVRCNGLQQVARRGKEESTKGSTRRSAAQMVVGLLLDTRLSAHSPF